MGKASSHFNIFEEVSDSKIPFSSILFRPSTKEQMDATHAVGHSWLFRSYLWRSRPHCEGW